MIVKGLTVGLLQENCYFFACSRTRQGVIIDPGDNARAILRVVDQNNLKIEKIINDHFDLRPGAIIRTLNLRRPIYQATAAYGHFGRTDLDLPWEKLDVVEKIKKSL